MARRDTERLGRRRVRGAPVQRHRTQSRDGNRTNLFARALAGGDAVSFNVCRLRSGEDSLRLREMPAEKVVALVLGYPARILSSCRFNRRLPMANVVCICRLLQFSIRGVFFRCRIHLAAGRRVCLRSRPRGDVTPKKHGPDTRRCRLDQRARTDGRRLGKTTEQRLPLTHNLLLASIRAHPK
jgi:hypothetical protein